MPTESDKQKKLHYDLTFVGLRAQATAIGLVQLCIELRRASLIDGQAVERIKNAIADELTLGGPRAIPRETYRRDVHTRLDRLFAGEEGVGSADALSFGAPQQ